MNAPRKIASLGFLEPESFEVMLDEKIREAEGAIARVRLHVAPMAIASLVVKYNAADTTLPFSEWVLEGLNGVIFPWIDSDSLHDKLARFYAPSDSSLVLPRWPAEEIAEAMNQHLDALLRIPSEDGGLKGVVDGLEAYVVPREAGGYTKNIQIRKKL